MRSLRTTQILASRSLLLSARSTAPRPPPPRWPLGKELPLVPSSRALQRWIAGAVSFSLTFMMAAAAEVRAKERLPTDLLPQNVMLYQYQAFPFCNKVRDLRRISWSMSISNILFDLIRYKPEVGDIIVGRVIEIAPKRWRLDMNFSQDAVLMLSSMNLPNGIHRRRTAVDELNMRSIFEENVVCPINDMDFIRQFKVDVTTWSQAIATYDVPHP